MIEHLFIDLDGTVWDLTSDSKKILSEIYSELVTNFKLPDFEVFYFNYNKINLGLWEKYKKYKISRQILEERRFRDTLTQIGVIDEKVFLYIFDEYLKRLPDKTTLFEGALEALTKLSKNYKLHIISNGFKELQYKKMKDTGLSNIFSNIFISEEVGIMKPELRLFYYAMEKSGTNIKNSYMIGDDINTDLIPAKEIGMKQIYFNPLQKTNELEFTLTVNTWHEIEEYFTKKLILIKNSNCVNAPFNSLP